MKKPLRCKLGFHEWAWDMTNNEDVCLLCGETTTHLAPIDWVIVGQVPSPGYQHKNWRKNS